MCGDVPVKLFGAGNQMVSAWSSTVPFLLDNLLREALLSTCLVLFVRVCRAARDAGPETRTSDTPHFPCAELRAKIVDI